MGKLATLRVVDDHATKLAGGFRKPELVAVSKIWPIVSVKGESGKFMEFAADASIIRSGLERALGDDRESVNIHVGTGSYNTSEVSVAVPTFDRELRNVPEDLRGAYQEKKDELAQSIHLLAMEYAVAQKLKTAGEYDGSMTAALAGANQWKESTATPFKNLRTALRAVSSMTGKPTTELGIAFATKPLEAFQDHAETRDRVKYTGGEVTLAWIAQALNCGAADLLGGKYASAFNPDDPTDVTFTDIFDDEVIVYPIIQNPSVIEPLWGAICRVEGYPVVTRYRDEPRSADIVANDENYGIHKRSNKRGYLLRTVSGLT
jgi:hypothetical protein